MKNLFKIVFILFTVFSCNIAEDMDDSIDIGNKYRVILDKPMTIICHKGSKYEGIGDMIVPDVISYNFNNRYIIAKSFGTIYKDTIINQWIEGREKILQYWIIDKKTNGAQTESLDSINFYKKLIELNIDLKFKNPVK